ncbi:hypothetical protein BHE74_00048175, partial [Ensete ventricosum]
PVLFCFNLCIRESTSHSCKEIEESGYGASPLVLSSGYHLANEDNSEKSIGGCIIPMPDSLSLASEIRVILHNTFCNCLDKGSVRCVRQHVKEAREKLKKVLGQEKFDQLGLCDMGENVAHRWTEEEEHLFEDVVFSNPASLGKNFWNVLPYFFPARSCKELVSYYFNVFILRKRAEQNRLDLMNVDSDDDEWPDTRDGDLVVEEEDGDSIVVSFAYKDPTTSNKCDDEDAEIHEDFEDGDECDDDYGVSEGYNIGKSNFHIDKNLQNSMVEQDVQDDSCTSYEGQHGGFHGQCSTNSGEIGITCGEGDDNFFSGNHIDEEFRKEVQWNNKLDGHNFSQS